MITLVSAGMVCAAYSGGSGTTASPYKIATRADLLTMSATPSDWGKKFMLTADIDLSGVVFTRAVIAPDTDNATDWFQGTIFSGVFDGNGHLIRNLTLEGAEGDFAGLFGYIGNGGEVKRLGLKNATVTGRAFTGGLCGYLWYSQISESYVSGAVSGTAYVGGISGYNWIGQIYQSYASGTVSGTDYVGGFCGENWEGVIRECYAVCAVTGDGLIGGFCGNNHDGVISVCFWDTVISGQAASDGGTGRTTSQMKNRQTFTGSGWDFSNTDGDRTIWQMPSEDYPRLLWETITYVSVPNLRGMTQVQAASVLLASGLELGTVTEAYSFVVAAGQVISQNPAFGVTVQSGASVTVVISLGVKYSGGGGTASDPYLLATAEDLITLGESVVDYDKYFIVTADIDLSGESFEVAVIAPDTDPATAGFQGTAFTGVFDGDGYVISGLSLDGADTDYAGLFGCLGSGGQVKHLGLRDADVTGRGVVGGLCGYSEGQISQCYVTGSVSGEAFAGGLCGENEGMITDCFAAAVVTGDDSVGGLCGVSEGEVENSYALGAVTGDTRVGGLVGLSADGSTTNSFWDVETSGQAASEGGEGKTTAEMQTLSTFADAGWDFYCVWDMSSASSDFAGYPVLMVNRSRALMITKFTVKSGKAASTDSLQLSGMLSAEADDLQAAGSIAVSFNAETMDAAVEWEFPINASTFKNGQFSGKEANSSLTFSTKNGKLNFSAKNASLTGLSCPVKVTVRIGEYTAPKCADENVVNGTKPCPPQLLKEVLNWMSLSKAGVKLANQAWSDSLDVSGYFTIEEAFDFGTVNPLIISLGGLTFTVPREQFVVKKNTISCNKGVSLEGPSVKAKFDFDKCTFQIQVKNAEIDESGTVDFGINCFGYELPAQAVSIPE
jgi:hypothetical protein